MTNAASVAPKAHFNRQYQTHLKHLKRRGPQPKTIDAYSRAIRRIGLRFDHRIDSLTEAQLTDYFTELITSHSWSTVKRDLYGLKFFTTHVLRKPWVAPGLIKPPRAQRLPDVITIEEARRIFAATRVLSYRVFFFTLYSLGLRLGDGLRLQLSDIDAAHARVHIRDAKGNKDRLVPMQQATLDLLRRFWRSHRNPLLPFPNRHAGVKGAPGATTSLDRGGVQITLRKVAAVCGVKKDHPALLAPLCRVATYAEFLRSLAGDEWLPAINLLGIAFFLHGRPPARSCWSRNSSHPAPPPQIRTCGTTAYGSCLGS